VVGIKGEYVDVVKVEEDPWPATSTGIKTEPVVSLCVCARALCQVYAPLAEKYKRSLKPDVNGQFNASVHILHYYRDFPIPIKFYI
jgi:hypothetical protein